MINVKLQKIRAVNGAKCPQNNYEAKLRLCFNGKIAKESGDIMVDLTTKELTALEDQLGLEQNMIKKYRMYSTLCTDPQLKAKCEQIAAQHTEHFNKLLSHLGG